MKKGMLFILLSIVLLLTISPTMTYALSCVEMPTGEQGYAEYDGIIIGHVEDVVLEKDNNIIKLKVIKSYKQIEEEQIPVKENVTWGSLWGPSEIGEDYLYYLSESDSGWENPLCSPTMKIADAAEEMTLLKDKEVPMNKTITPTETFIDNNGIAESIPDYKVSQISKTNESTPKSVSTKWLGIVMVACVVSGVVLVLWRRWSARK